MFSRGLLVNFTRTAQLQPDSADFGRAGHKFLVAQLPSGPLFAYNPSSGWQPFDMNAPATWGPANAYDDASIAVNADFRSLSGVVIYLGYTPAASLAEMLASQRYKLGYVIP